VGGKNVAPRGRGITANNQTTIIAMSGVVVMGLCGLFYIVSQLFHPVSSSLIAEYFPSPTPTRVPTSTPASTRTPPTNLTATQQAWGKPAESPSLASAAEAGTALDSGVNHLEGYAYVVPDTPAINQPGDVYSYEIQLTESTPLVWSYGWCTTTQAILEENFSHINLEFTINGTAVSSGSFAVTEYERSDGGRCREHAALVNDWPPGQHIIESRITFTQDINDGWDIYPAGTHIFKYLVTVGQ
jgi:hypothetical protein